MTFEEIIEQFWFDVGLFCYQFCHALAAMLVLYSVAEVILAVAL